MTHNNHCPLEDKDKLLKRPNMCRAVSQFLWFFWLSWGPLGSLVSLKVDQFHYSHISRHFLWEIYNWILFISSLWELTEALYLFPGSMWCISTENTVASWIFSTLENISCSYFWFSLVWQLSLYITLWNWHLDLYWLDWAESLSFVEQCDTNLLPPPPKSPKSVKILHTLKTPDVFRFAGFSCKELEPFVDFQF